MKPLAGIVIAMGIELWAQTVPQQPVFTKVPQKARLKCNPLAGERTAVPAGGKLFRQHCAECHGKDAEGTKKAPMLVGGEMVDATPGEIFWVLTNGVVRKGMPEWSRLPPAQRWQIVAFLESLNRP